MRVGLPVLLLVACAGLGACAGPEPDVERLAALEERNARLERSLAEARERADELRRRHRASPWVIVCPAYPPIDTSVVSIGEGHVVLAKGRADGVKAGYTFDVYRGSTFKGQARVVEVLESSSRALILSQKVAIEVGDLATTTL